jgi:radical SAM-linked protein
VDLRSGPDGEPVDEARSIPRQRWRLVLARSATAPDLVGRELAEAWDRAIAATGLPLYRPSGSGRIRVAWAAPLPGHMAAERELGEIVLSESLPVWRVREALTACLPAGWSLVDVQDVWLGSPALAGRVTGAVYRVALTGDVRPGDVTAAAASMLAAHELIRTRMKGGGSVTYDLRPLLGALHVIDPGPPVVVRIETRTHPERGSGRPEEVVAALGERLGRPLAIGSIVRERLILSAGAD